VTRPPAVVRVETERLILRSWEAADAPELRAVLDAEDDHLRPYIPWMRDEPRSLEATATWLSGHADDFAAGRSWRFPFFDRSSGALLGQTGLFDRVGELGLETGYWVRRAAVGRGYASEATSAMVRLAFDLHGVDRVEIHHAVENETSGAVARRLGFTCEATLRRRAVDSEGGIHDRRIWSLFAEEFPDSPAARVDVAAWGAGGERRL